MDNFFYAWAMFFMGVALLFLSGGDPDLIDALIVVRDNFIVETMK